MARRRKSRRGKFCGLAGLGARGGGGWTEKGRRMRIPAKETGGILKERPLLQGAVLGAGFGCIYVGATAVEVGSPSTAVSLVIYTLRLREVNCLSRLVNRAPEPEVSKESGSKPPYPKAFLKKQRRHIQSLPSSFSAFAARRRIVPLRCPAPSGSPSSLEVTSWQEPRWRASGDVESWASGKKRQR
uniref:Uncharacterized protein n=1 Tax=Oryza brachyantha TaxID=4533 RepID=J3MXU7_ORYBR